MPGPFDALLAASDAIVDKVFAEAFAFTPMREIVNGKPIADSNRDEIAAVMATFDNGGRLLVAGSAVPPERASTGPMLTVLETLMPQGVKTSDRFTRASDGQVYEVRDKRPDGLGRLLVFLAER